MLAVVEKMAKEYLNHMEQLIVGEDKVVVVEVVVDNLVLKLNCFSKILVLFIYMHFFLWSKNAKHGAIKKELSFSGALRCL